MSAWREAPSTTRARRSTRSKRPGACSPSTGALPVNLKLLIEGEEEVGSPHFEALLVGEAERFRCDVIVVSDTGMVAPDVPSTTVGMRGLVAFDVSLRTAAIDLHSGMWGGAVPNAARLAARLAASLHDAEGRVTLPGFYDRVRELSPEEKASLAAQPFDEAAFRAAAGGVAVPRGRSRATPRWSGSASDRRPRWSACTGATAVPASRPSCRRRPGSKWPSGWSPTSGPRRSTPPSGPGWPSECPPGVTLDVTAEGAVAPALTAIDQPAMHALARAIASVWGQAPLYTREGGSGPEEALGRLLARSGPLPRSGPPGRPHPCPQRANGHEPVLEGAGGCRGTPIELGAQEWPGD